MKEGDEMKKFQSLFVILMVATFVGAMAARGFAVEMKIILKSNPPATLPTVYTVVDLPDPSDQVELSKQAAFLALSPDGWNLEQRYGGELMRFLKPNWTEDMYGTGSIDPSASEVLGYELNPEAWQYGPYFGLAFHDDFWVARGGHDICESEDNFGVISGIMSGYWVQCAVPDWGEFSAEEVVECLDLDGDGYGYPVSSFCAFSEIDCDDSDPLIFPGAEEICDGKDNNCDGVVDEGFEDADGDGSAMCVDCDDTDPAVNPDAEEICENEIDDDCDGYVDFFDPDCGTLLVPEVFSTIQAGIDAAEEGDVVLVGPGTYVEKIAFSGQKITVQGKAGAELTVIDGNSGGSVVVFSGGETKSTVLDGFTITNGNVTFGGGIWCSGNSDPWIRNCKITGNTVGMQGGGIYCKNNAAPMITSCVISGNSAVIGGGIMVTQSNLTIENCTISENSAIFGGGIFAGYDTPQVENCIIIGNSADYGGGICCYDSDADIKNCTISGNAADYGGAIFGYGSDSPLVTNCILWGDTASMGPEILTVDGIGVCLVQYSVVDGGWPGYAVINADPLFVGEGDYHLSDASPAIDAGAPYDEHKDACFPPSRGSTRNDIGAYGGPRACGYVCWDYEGDGYYAEYCGGTDCDDRNPEIYPEAPELCDGEDNDCDGEVPEDEVDGDGDEVMLCEDDCDDEDPDVYPGAEEVCDNGIDDDCDEDIDGADQECFIFSTTIECLDPIAYPGETQQLLIEVTNLTSDYQQAVDHLNLLLWGEHEFADVGIDYLWFEPGESYTVVVPFEWPELLPDFIKYTDHKWQNLVEEYSSGQAEAEASCTFQIHDTPNF